MANLAFKAGAVALLGTSRLLLWIAALFGLAMAIGVLVIVLWPAPKATEAEPGAHRGPEPMSVQDRRCDSSLRRSVPIGHAIG